MLGVFQNFANLKIYHNGVKQTSNELRAEFWINRGRSYVRKLLNSYLQKLLNSSFYLQTSSIPKLQLARKLKFTIVSKKNATVLFQVCGVDYLGPLYVKDI